MCLGYFVAAGSQKIAFVSANRGSNLPTKGGGPEGSSPCVEHAVLVPGGCVKGITEDQFDDAGDLLLKLGTVRVHEEIGAGECLANVLPEFFLEFGFVTV